MIRARHRRFFVIFFMIYTKMMLWRHFHQVVTKADFKDRGLPLIMVGNHFSWWDGFIANFINNTILHRKFYIMMMEEQLASRMFLSKAGAYSINKSSRSMAESLIYSSELLKDRNNLVVLYPQGEFESLYQRPVHFERGISWIASKNVNPIQLIFYVALVDYFSNRKPTLTVYLREFPASIALDHLQLEAEFNRFLQECQELQKEQ
jgi:1-acyl-sn-glycerol-3-phosphate acyltransferase